VSYDGDGDIDTIDCYFANNPIVFWAIDSVYTVNFNYQVNKIKLSSYYNKMSIVSYNIRTISGSDSTVKLDSALYHSTIPDSNVISLNLFLNPLDSSWDYNVILSGIISPTQISSINSIQQSNIKSTFSIYPNPSADVIFIDCENSCDGYLVKITNSLGQTINQSVLISQITPISLKEYAGSGVLYITLLNINNSFTQSKEIILK
jgi:hypothetical protein